VGNARGSEHARYLKKSGEGVTPDVSVTNFCIVCHRGGCRSGLWEELMGTSLTYASPPRMMTQEVMMVEFPKSK
jgi:hypothetical protein